MARQVSSKIEGTVGNLIFYTRLGTYCMRAKPAGMRQTKATRKSALNFGKASKICAKICQVVEPLMPPEMKTNMRSRLTGVLNSFIGWNANYNQGLKGIGNNIPFLRDFQFNGKSNLSEITAIRASVKSTGSNTSEISLEPFVPQKSFYSPPNQEQILFSIRVLKVDFDNIKTETINSSEMSIPFDNNLFQAPAIPIDISSMNGSLLILVLAVRYVVRRNGRTELMADPKKFPCGILWAGMLN